MSVLNSALEDLWLIADGSPGPKPVDSVTSIENHCRTRLDDQLIGATAQRVPAILRHSFTSGIVPKSEQHAEVVDLREQLLRFIEWLVSEEYVQTRGLPEEQIAEYATEIVKVCILVFRWEPESNDVRVQSCLGAPRRPRPPADARADAPPPPVALHPLDTPLPP